MGLGVCWVWSLEKTIRSELTAGDEWIEEEETWSFQEPLIQTQKRGWYCSWSKDRGTPQLPDTWNPE